MTTDATRRLAEWAAEVTPESLPSEVRHHVRRLVVDYLGAAVSGSDASLSRKLRATLPTVAPGDQATVINGGRVAATAAAFANGSAAHGLELDDGYTPGSVHPSAATLPAVLALAEWEAVDPSRVVAAVAVAVETTTRVAAAAHPATLEAGFHNTPIAGVFGAAAGSVVLRGGNASTVASSLGLAGSHAGGLREYHAEGSEIKRLHAGKAARDGLTCALLALAGVTGPHTVLEGAQGYFQAFARGNWRPDVLLDELGSSWSFLRTYVKPYPCCRHLHGPIDAALALHARGAAARGRIERIEVATYGLATRFARRAPASFLEAQLSIPHAVAAALVRGKVDLPAFSDAVRESSEVRRISSLVTVRGDSDCDERYPSERPAQVNVLFEDGEQWFYDVAQPLGEPDNPIDDSKLNEKFMSLVQPVLGERRARATLAAAWLMEDLTPITSALAADERTDR